MFPSKCEFAVSTTSEMAKHEDERVVTILFMHMIHVLGELAVSNRLYTSVPQLMCLRFLDPDYDERDLAMTVVKQLGSIVFLGDSCSNGRTRSTVMIG